MKRIGIITSGGDAPGMNACLRAVVKKALGLNIQVLGIRDGYQGMIEGRGEWMDYESVNNIVHRGGTIIGTARSKEFLKPEGRAKAIDYLEHQGIDGLIIIGGDGSFKGAKILSDECNIPVIGLPGTIDNDIYGTDFTIGYDTALNTVVEAVDRIRDTANSHHRIFFIEVMGRDAGFIALNSALASGADGVLIPEEKTDLKDLAEELQSARQAKRSSIVIVAEGDDAGGAKEVAEKMKVILPNHEARVTILGHIQRGGSPSAMDRVLATKLGAAAVDHLLDGYSEIMLGIRNGQVTPCSFDKSIKLHLLPDLGLSSLISLLRTK
jgi:6-phosphofructokinase 1